MTQDAVQTVAYDEIGPSPGDILGPGSVVGDYVVGDLIARGGCGAVYHARSKALDRPAALKVLHAILAAHPKIVGRFFREVEVINLLRHPNIVEINACGVLPDRRPFYAMEYLPGGTLNDLLREKGRLHPEEAYEVIEPVCAALSAAHAAGIVHRDVKASNIAFTTEPRVAKLLDFGIAKLLSPEPGRPALTTVGHTLGTPNCMAPEQLLGGTVDGRADVYALGVLLYRLLTGRQPFEERSIAAMVRRHLEEPAPRPSRVTTLSPALDAVVLRCLAKQPEHRFDSVKAFIAALGCALGRGAGGAESTRLAPSQGVAVYVDVRLRTSDDPDEALIADLGALIDLAEGTLTRAGYVLAQATANGILAVRPLPHDPGERCLARRSAVALALSLHDEIARRPGADPRVHANIAVHAGEALLRGSDTPEVLGGALLHTAAWVPLGEAGGVCATRDAVEGLPDLEAMTQAGLILTDAETV